MQTSLTAADFQSDDADGTLSAEQGSIGRDSDPSDGPSGNTEGVAHDGQTGETVETIGTDELLSTIAEQNTVIASLSLVIVVGVFLCFGAMCVQTLLRALEVRR